MQRDKVTLRKKSSNINLHTNISIFFAMVVIQHLHTKCLGNDSGLQTNISEANYAECFTMQFHYRCFRVAPINGMLPFTGSSRSSILSNMIRELQQQRKYMLRNRCSA